DEDARGAKDGGDDPNVPITKEGKPVWPIPDDWRADPSTKPADDHFGAERIESGRHVIFETVVQDSRDHYANDQQNQETSEVLPNHDCLPACLLETRDENLLGLFE